MLTEVVLRRQSSNLSWLAALDLMSRGSPIVPRQLDLKARTRKPLPAGENELEGRQDMGGKQGGQAGFPKPTKRPRTTRRDEDVVTKRGERDAGR